MNKKGMLGNLIGGFLIIIIGVMLIPAISQQIEKARTSEYEPMPTAASMVLGFIPLFFGLAIVGIALMVVVSALRNAGLMEGNDDEYRDIKPKRKKSGKQTYLQFVQERLAVEREMRRSRGLFWWIRG